MKFRSLSLLALLALALPACTHVKGVVLDERTRKPVPDAEFTVGHPTSMAIYSRHHVDAQGQFDFYISPTDEPYLYVWDGQGDTSIGPRKIQRPEISDHMTIYYRSGAGW